MCVPRKEGGLGFRRFKAKEWNKASMIRHFRVLCKKEDILWVKWIHSHTITNQFLWHMNLPSDLRKDGQSFMKSIIGDGQSTFLWLDNWHKLRPFYKKFGDSGV